MLCIENMGSKHLCPRPIGRSIKKTMEKERAVRSVLKKRILDFRLLLFLVTAELSRINNFQLACDDEHLA